MDLGSEPTHVLKESMKRIGLIRVISGRGPEERETHARLLTDAYPSLRVITDEIEGFPQGIHNQELARKAVPAILSVAKRLAPRVDTLVLDPVLAMGAILSASL